ncbi:hypothetical protein [Luteibacter sp. SG786]|uniref:hypothetical protein n=1 Tax=Luteibacter sp. SG786 TaxID=2587130 RepID=UPI00141E332E|nr:hypothetical protein [Luteibacter sp. SG786]NII54925.1 hypothetical protein [Luteibacter sp. SG786]
MIGIGVITTDVRSVPEAFPSLCEEGSLVRIEKDVEKAGAAVTRNKCLRYLMDQGCEHVFLFDDDCYPTMKGWERYVIDEAARHNMHFIGLPEIFKSRPLASDGELIFWDRVIGCFCYQTRALLQAIGGYNPSYVRYGYNDVARPTRALRSGLAGDGKGYPSLLRLPSYIHSMDVHGENPVPNFSPQEKARWRERNWVTFREEIESEVICYPL